MGLNIHFSSTSTAEQKRSNLIDVCVMLLSSLACFYVQSSCLQSCTYQEFNYFLTNEVSSTVS